ncbi:hypothetical protein KY289_023454 [Solanum tuberosum]|nr:hypothetical protein KY289_023454 [Solanum tuberosum]
MTHTRPIPKQRNPYPPLPTPSNVNNSSSATASSICTERQTIQAAGIIPEQQRRSQGNGISFTEIHGNVHSVSKTRASTMLQNFVFFSNVFLAATAAKNTCQPTFSSLQSRDEDTSASKDEGVN